MVSYRYKSGSSLIPQALSLASQQLAFFIYPSVLTSSILFALRRNASIPLASYLPTWAVVLSGLLSIPAFHIGRAKINDIVTARKAAKIGAQLPPRWKGTRIGSIDLLARMIESATNGFLSMSIPANNCNMTTVTADRR